MEIRCKSERKEQGIDTSTPKLSGRGRGMLKAPTAYILGVRKEERQIPAAGRRATAKGTTAKDEASSASANMLEHQARGDCDRSHWLPPFPSPPRRRDNREDIAYSIHEKQLDPKVFLQEISRGSVLTSAVDEDLHGKTYKSSFRVKTDDIRYTISFEIEVHITLDGSGHMEELVVIQSANVTFRGCQAHLT